MTRVTFLTGEYPPMQGGIADHTAYLAAHMTPLGVQSSILTHQRWQQQATEAQISPDGAPPTRQPVFPVLTSWSWRCWPGVARFLTKHQPHILHIQYQAAAFDLKGWIHWLPWYLQRRGGPTKIVTTFHDLRIPYIFPKAGQLRQKSVLALAHHSDAIICTNPEDMQLLSARLRRKDSPMPPLAQIPLGSNIEPKLPPNFDRAAWRSRYNIDDSTLLLGYFGFLNHSKGAEELIEALALLRSQGIDAQLLLIGGETGHVDPTNLAYAEQVKQQIAEHQLTPYVHRTGYVENEEVSANFTAADALVMPYRDGVSFRRTTLIAALRHGCPVISTRPSNVLLPPEIDPGENMLLVPPRDAPALAQTIAPLANNPVLRAKLGYGARRLGNLFDWSEIAGQTAALYQTLFTRA